jgi:hypothetical protein
VAEQATNQQALQLFSEMAARAFEDLPRLIEALSEDVGMMGTASNDVEGALKTGYDASGPEEVRLLYRKARAAHCLLYDDTLEIAQNALVQMVGARDRAVALPPNGGAQEVAAAVEKLLEIKESLATAQLFSTITLTLLLGLTAEYRVVCETFLQRRIGSHGYGERVGKPLLDIMITGAETIPAIFFPPLAALAVPRFLKRSYESMRTTPQMIEAANQQEAAATLTRVGTLRDSAVKHLEGEMPEVAANVIASSEAVAHNRSVMGQISGLAETFAGPARSKAPLAEPGSVTPSE